MTLKRLPRLGLAAVFAAALAVTTPSIAAAAPAAVQPGATAAMGSTNMTLANGQQVVINPLAPCDTVNGPASNHSNGAAQSNVVTYGAGDTACTKEPSKGSAAAQGANFKLEAMLPYGGPRIRMSKYLASCTATENGSSGRIEFSGFSGITVPSDIPPNYKVTIQGNNPNEPLAEVILNEFVVPSPPDGSMTLNLMRVKFAPKGTGPLKGDVIVGSVRCDPQP